MSHHTSSAREQAIRNQLVEECSEAMNKWVKLLESMIAAVWSKELPTILARKEEITIIFYDDALRRIVIDGAKRRGDMLGYNHPAIASIAQQELLRYQPRADRTTLVFAVTLGGMTLFTFFENVDNTLTSLPPQPDKIEMYASVEN